MHSFINKHSLFIHHHLQFWGGVLGIFYFRLKAVAYPVTGAFIGGVIGGPIGLVAGLKVGGIAAIGCAIAGYTGGRFLNKTRKSESVSNELEGTRTESELPESSQKKDMWQMCHIC